MRHGKSALAAFVALAGLAAPAHAQQFGEGGFGGNAFGGNGIVSNGIGFGGVGGFGPNAAFGGLGYGTGLGGFPVYSGFNAGFQPIYQPIPQTYNNLGGLANTIRTQTGRGNSYRPNNAVGGFRRR